MPRPDTSQRANEFWTGNSFANGEQLLITPAAPRRATLVVAQFEVEGSWVAANKTFTCDLKTVDEDDPTGNVAGDLLDYCTFGSGPAGAYVWQTLKLVGIISRGKRYRLTIGHDGGPTSVYMTLGSLCETPLPRAY